MNTKPGSGVSAYAPNVDTGLATIRIDNGEKVIVVLVDKALDFRAGAILAQQLVGEILNGLSLI